MSIDAIRKPAPDPWAGWLPGDERPELPVFRHCLLSDCASKGKEQAVSPNDEACGFCGFHWDSEELKCRHCGHVEVIGPDDNPDHCCACGMYYPS